MFSSAGFFQSVIVPGNLEANLSRLQGALQDDPPAAGTLLALPELWATGFVYPQLKTLSRQTSGVLNELVALAVRYGVTFAGTMVEHTDTGVYNTLFVTDSSGVAGKIRKQHLFSYWQEDKWLLSGTMTSPVVVSDGCVGGMICYDLRFPETARSQCRQGADVLVVSAQWPLTRIDQWRVLLQARAIENQIYVLAANGCGMCNDLELGGHSLLIDPAGHIVLEAGTNEQFSTVPLVPEIQQQLRCRFNTVADAGYFSDDAEKIVSLTQCAQKVEQRKKAGQRIVFTNGCFDILHAGHVEYLQEARKQGDFLIVGLNRDCSIRSIKGESRPVNPEMQRARVLAALGCVDAVVLFGDDTPLELIRTLLPHVLVKGADWAEEAIVGAREVKAAGGRVERIAFTTQTSTSGIINRIKGGEVTSQLDAGKER